MAGRISKTFINQLIIQADIVAIINRYVALNNKNKACCPFHNEKTPSFTVNADKQFFYCFGCSASGNVIGFLMQHQNLDFIEAVEALARECGVDIQYDSTGENPQNYKIHKEQQEQQFEMLMSCAKYYQKCLKENHVAQEYLHQRGISDDTIEQFMLGIAPNRADYLKNLFGNKYDEGALIKAGMLSRQESGSLYTRFRNRIMFPIRDRMGKTIAFGGRVLPKDSSPAKYMNSPETDIFQKRKELYGIYEIRQAGQYDQVIVVEGYMDVIALAQNNIHNVLATLGTAVTRAHIQKIFRLTSHIVFCFDGDEAGYKAAVRAMEQSLTNFAAGQEVDFMFLPSGSDPDSFVSEKGSDAFIKAIGEAKSVADFLFDHCLQNLDLNNPSHSADFAEKAYALINQIPGGIFRDKMYARLANMLGIDVGQLHQYHKQNDTFATTSSTSTKSSSTRLQYDNFNIALGLLLQHPEFADLIPDDDMAEELKRTNARLLIEILTQIKHDQSITTSVIIEQYRDTDYQEMINRLLVWQSPTQDLDIKKQEFIDAFENLRKEAIKQEVQNLQKKENLTPEEGQHLINLLKKI